MIEIIIATFLVVSVMILLMFVMLQKIVKSLNEKSKAYFIGKLQDYDELIELKSKQLDILNKELQHKEKAGTKIEKTELIDFGYSYDEIVTPSYENEALFKQYKKINDKFDINYANIIKKFIDSNTEDQDDVLYQRLIRISDKLQFNYVYELVMLEDHEQINKLKEILEEDELALLNKYPKENFNILEFKSYIEDMIQKEDPTIYIAVGNEIDNYDNLNSFIKTKYDEKICKGIMIIYKNKIYDYSLS